ncbi:MAG: hypothetical protein IJS13_04890 [Paludibacteraceae bacterium]|nr:hypothetical protein [Paludibacteraceae bacterium]
MKTKIIPFDLETAKKIQAGEADGKIKTRCGYAARILCTDLIGQAQPVLAAFNSGNSESESHYTKRGCFYINGELSDLDLVLEVPDTEPQFKPFDRVLVRDDDTDEWCIALYAYRTKTGFHRMVGGARWRQCIHYEGNEELVGTMDKPKEE